MALTVYKYRDIVLTTEFYRSYLLKRIIRIIPAYYAAILVWNILLSEGVTFKTHNASDNILHLLLIHNLYPSTLYSISGVFWSIATEMQFYVIFPIVFVLCLRYLWLMIPVFAGITLYLNFNFIPKLAIGEYKEYWEVVSCSLLNYLILFILGIGGYLYKDKIAEFFKNRFIFGAYILFILHFLFADDMVVPQGFVNHVVAGALLGGLMVAVSTWNFESLPFRAIARIGIYSYSIYLYNYIFYIHEKPVYTGLIGWIIYTLLILVFGIFMYYVVEKPAQWLKRFNRLPSVTRTESSVKG